MVASLTAIAAVISGTYHAAAPTQVKHRVQWCVLCDIRPYQRDQRDIGKSLIVPEQTNTHSTTSYSGPSG